MEEEFFSTYALITGANQIPFWLVSGFKISQLLAYFPKSLIQFSIVRSLRCFDWATLDEVLAIHSFLGGVSEYPAYNN